MFEAKTIPDLYAELVPEYKSKVFPRPFIACVHNWDDRYGKEVHKINPQRAQNRIDSYIIPEEIIRVNDLVKLEGKKDFSIRFGKEKIGRGYHGKRGDFCLVGGSVEATKHLTLYYRSLELIGGFGYDLCLIRRLSRQLGIEWKTVTFLATRANVFALKRNSNEALYPKLLEIFND